MLQKLAQVAGTAAISSKVILLAVDDAGNACRSSLNSSRGRHPIARKRGRAGKGTTNLYERVQTGIGASGVDQWQENHAGGSGEVSLNCSASAGVPCENDVPGVRGLGQRLLCLETTTCKRSSFEYIEMFVGSAAPTFDLGLSQPSNL